MDTVNILGVHVSMLGITAAADKIMQMLDSDRTHAVFTPKSEIVMSAYKD